MIKNKLLKNIKQNWTQYRFLQYPEEYIFPRAVSVASRANGS